MATAAHSNHAPLGPNSNLAELENPGSFIGRHIGPSALEQTEMLAALGLSSLDELTKKTIPAAILRDKSLDLATAKSEDNMLATLRSIASRNRILKSCIGMGYHGTRTPNVILRNVLENPGWYTAYTPYQAEIAQGRLEALLNFQTMIMELTGMEISNASLLDEGTAAAEAMHMAMGLAKGDRKTVFVSSACHPQTIEVVRTRAEPLAINVVVGTTDSFTFNADCFAALLQYPATDGSVHDYAAFAAQASAAGAMTIVAADLLSLTTLKPPGEWGADIVVGSAQRFGVPMGFGGPHAGFLATRDKFKRDVPGRLVGVSVDSSGKPALRLALQTREQHIRREKATSNICTAQVLLAVMAGMYAAYHGPHGLTRIALRVRRLALTFAAGLQRMGVAVPETVIFDTVRVPVEAARLSGLLEAARAAGFNLRQLNATAVCVAFDETSSREDIEALWAVFRTAGVASAAPGEAPFDAIESSIATEIPLALRRSSAFLQQKVFNSFHSETEMLRYLYRLQGKDLSLAHSMIPLGSCTMKLNATAEMIPVSWPEFSGLHPFAPLDQAQGYLQMIRELEGWLQEITGFAAVSVQPNAGSQGEYAGLLAIRGYHQSRGDTNRDICLIPSSAHGTNPASAVMCGMKVVVVKCDDDGNVDVADLRVRAEEHRERLAALMITYPSTHGVFEESIVDICALIHERGGQVYMDGANFNALVGLCRPGDFGPDVCHLNLHKTFCIPHGGGGPGVGPIGVREHLKAFLPGHASVDGTGSKTGLRASGAVSAAPWGSASILCISWAYIAMMGRDGLKRATQVAILNANYMAKRLEPHFPILYKGRGGMVAHECIIDLRPIKAVSAEDVCKRLMDFGFHAPTMSWPVTGTLMIEPTESESKDELDRYCDAMIAIRHEIAKIENGEWSETDNPLKNAPHTMQDIARSDWTRAYSREAAAFPLPWTRERKFWPAVGRVNNPHGDRHFVCSCAPLEDYK